MPSVAVHMALVGVWNHWKSPRGVTSIGHVYLMTSQLDPTMQLVDEVDKELDPLLCHTAKGSVGEVQLPTGMPHGTCKTY